MFMKEELACGAGIGPGVAAADAGTAPRENVGVRLDAIAEVQLPIAS
jgi:hypothetical protein